MPPKSKSQLGKTVIKSRFRGRHRPQDDSTDMPQSYAMDEDTIASSLRYQSITQENDLDAFLRNAELAGTEFTAEKLNVQLLALNNTHSTTNPFLLTAEQERAMRTKMNMHRDKLRIPRRPAWTKEMSRRELDANERESFLEWRRELAVLDEEMGLVLTPFERNLEVWRQLWRVMERSDIVVQIVDARDPLFFRCEDLDNYVKEVDPEKQSLLLINKSDFLTAKQRSIWARYLQSKNIPFLFFSAALSAPDIVSPVSEDSPVNMEEDEDDYIHVPPVVTVESSEDEEEDVDDVAPPILSCSDLYDHLLTLKPEGKEKIVVGLVGYPNVGKSSTINALIGAKKVNVSSTPGKTKHFQTIVLTEEVTLCDCPGLVFPSFATTKAEMVINGVLPIDQLREHSAPCTLLAQRIPRYYMEWLYGMQIPAPGEGQDPDRPPTSSELLCTFAIARGFRKSGQGNPDEARAARILLKDYVNGKLVYVHAPPNFKARVAHGARTDDEAPDADDKEYIEFHQMTYRKGGPKYKEAQTARAYIAARTHAHANNPDTTKERPLGTALGKHAASSRTQLDSHFFSDDPLQNGTHLVKTVGKFKDVDFRRVNVFPHQSAYLVEAEKEMAAGGGNVSVPGSTIASTSRFADGSRGKKSHKTGKQRVKDRSWRA